MTTKLTTVVVTAALTTATVIPTVGTIATVTITAVATATVTTATVTMAVVTTAAVTTDADMASAEPAGVAAAAVTSADLKEPPGILGEPLRGSGVAENVLTSAFELKTIPKKEPAWFRTRALLISNWQQATSNTHQVSVRAQNDPKEGTRVVPNRSSVNK